MGRYDKIKVYNGSKFVNISRLRVHNGTKFVDFGTADSANTASLYVYDKNKNLVRVTLNKQIVTVPGESYANGPWNLIPHNGYCFNPGGGTFTLEGTIRKTRSDTDLRLFYIGTGGNFFEVWWLADGRLRITTSTTFGGGGSETVYSSNSVGQDQWVSFAIHQAYGTYNTEIWFNGVYTGAKLYSMFEVTGAYNVVGSDGIQFAGPFRCQGRRYGQGNTYFENNLSNISGTDGSTYENVNHVSTSVTEERWV